MVVLHQPESERHTSKTRSISQITVHSNGMKNVPFDYGHT